MKGVTLLKKDLIHVFLIAFMLIILGVLSGYFFGRYEQIIINKSLLQEIPDVNCGSKNKEL